MYSSPNEWRDRVWVYSPGNLDSSLCFIQPSISHAGVVAACHWPSLFSLLLATASPLAGGLGSDCPDSGSCPQSGERDRGLEPTVDSGAQLSRAPYQALNACVGGGGWQGGNQGTRQRQTRPAPRPTCPWPLSPRVGRGGFLERPPAAFPWEPWGGQRVSTASLAASPQHRTNQPQRQHAERSRG